MRIIIPKGATTNTELALRELTKAICKKTGESGGYGLGGEYGYGIDYENDIFMMHSFCWCEQDDCKWCNPDKDGNYAPNFIYKPTNTKIEWYKWIGRSQEQKGELPKDWLKKCLETLK